jgi:flagellar basal body-associated protein FliL
LVDSSQDSDTEVEAPKVEKRSGGRIVKILVVAVLVLGAAAAGSVFGPKLLQRAKAAEPAQKTRAIGDVVALDPILVDLRNGSGSLYHLKVVLSIELAHGAPKDEFMKYAPRGREAALTYLRGERYELVAAPEHFTEVKKQLETRVSQAIGSERVDRVLVTDFVAQ